eukprot:2425744-Alexandrium_andersonii.AAC.1
MSTSSTSHPANRNIADRPSFRWPGPEKRRRHRGAPPFTAGDGSLAAGSGTGGRLGSSSAHFFFCLPPPLPFL